MQKYVLLFLLLSSLLLCSLQAQVTTAQITGTITDPSGAVVPNVAITVANTETGLTRSTVTNQVGAYSFTFLPPGQYNFKADAKGFASILQNKITLVVGQVATLNFALRPGTAGEIVEVSGEAPLVETGRSDIGGAVSTTEVKELPIIDRNFAGLMTTIPGVRPAEAFDPTKTRSGNISINGSDGRAVDYNVDGADNKDNVIGGLVQNFTMEGIQEFQVVTNRYTAEAGRSVAGVVNVVSKSGTNTLHGSAFGLFQTSSLFTTNYLESQKCTADGRPEGDCKAKYHRQQFGGSIGGAAIKDKLFFFGAYENKREPGSMTASSIATNELQTFANATQGFPGAPYAVPIATLPFPYIDHLLTIKVDHKISDKQTMYYRYGRERWTNPNDQLGSTSAPFITDQSQTNTDTNQFHDFTIGHNYIVSENKTNALTLHFQDFVNLIGDAPGRTFTYPIANGTDATNPNINFPNAQVGINVNVPQETLIRKYQVRDDFSWVRGRHTMKFGANWIYLAKLGGYFYSAQGYTVTFWNDPSTIVSSSAYPQGFSTPGAVQDISYSAGSGSTAQPPSHSIGLYYQDDFKATRNLTLNLGLRWDANPNFLQSQLGDSLTNSNRTIWALREALAANPSDAAAQDGLAAMRNIAGDPSSLTRRTADWKEFQPRVGFAWDVTGSGKHVIRGGYGIARDQIFQNLTLWSVQQSQPSIYQIVLDQHGSAAPGDPNGCSGPMCTWRFGIDPLPSPAGTINDLAFGAVGRISSPQLTDPWSQQMSIGWAWQVAPDYAFSVDYTHILGTHEERVLNANPVISSVCDPAYGGNSADPRCVSGAETRLMDAAFQAANICGPTVEGTQCGAGRFAHIYDYSTNNRSRYDSVNFQLRKRMSHRFMFQTSYVLSWSRSWGGFPVAAYLGSGYAVTPEQQFAPGEFGRTNNDERHRVVFSGVFSLPGGIELSPLFQAASGRPYSYLSGDTDIDGDGRVVIDRVCAGSTLSDRIVTPGCTMIQPNTLTGKPFIQMDLRTAKNVKLTERLNMRLSVEFFNLFNRANFCNDYQEDSSSSSFREPLGFCGGPSGSGYSAAAVPSLHTQAGIRFEF